MLISGLILAAALATQAQEAPKPVEANPPAEAAKPAEPKKVCVTEAQLGSHFKKRICATQEEWDRRRERDAAEMSKMSDRTAACSGSSC
jgi:predicted secreted protein